MYFPSEAGPTLWGRTLLHSAVLACDEHLVRQLLAKGADHTARDALGLCPLDLVFRMLTMFPVTSPIHRKLTAIKDELSELPLAELNTELNLKLPAGIRLSTRSISEPLGPIPDQPDSPGTSNTVQLLLKMQKSYSNPSHTHVAADNTKLSQGLQQFTPVTLLRIISDSDGAIASNSVMHPSPASHEFETKIDSAPTSVQTQTHSHIYACEGICVVCDTAISAGAPRVCRACDTFVCIECVYRFTGGIIDAALYAVPVVRCSACLHRIPTENWRAALASFIPPHLEQTGAEELYDNKYVLNAERLLSYRCSSCHENLSLTELVGESEQDEGLNERMLEGMGDLYCESITQALQQYEDGQINAAAFMEMFIDDFEGLAESLQTGIAPAELKARVNALFERVSDLERRTGLQLAWYRKFPKFETLCCSCPMCFMCKVDGYHEGQTCQEMQQLEVSSGIQYCPACGVPTIRSEGCDHMVCVCGEDWYWQEDEQHFIHLEETNEDAV